MMLGQLGEVVTKILGVLKMEPIDQLFREILFTVRTSLGAEGGLFGYIDEDGRLTCPAIQGSRWEPYQRQDGLYVLEMDQLQELQMDALDCGSTDPMSGDCRSRISDDGCAISTLLCFRERPVGVLYLTDSVAPITSDEQDWVETLCSVLAPVIYDRMQSENRDQRVPELQAVASQEASSDSIESPQTTEPRLRASHSSDGMHGCPSDRAFEISPYGMLIVGEDELVLRANTIASEILDQPVPELEGSSWCELVPSTADLLRSKLRESENRSHFPRTVVRRTQLGHRARLSDIPVEVGLTPIFGSEKPAVLVTIIDITEHRTSERRLEQSEQRILDIVDNTEAVIYIKDDRGRYQLVNHKFETLFGKTRKEIIGQTDFDIFPEHMANQFRRNDSHVLETGEVLKCDEVAPLADGPHTYLSVKVPLRDHSGRVTSIAGISTDITDRVRVERQLHEYGQRLELILNSIEEGLFGVDQDGIITFVNPAASNLLGWRKDELIGKPQHVIATVDGRPDHPARLRESPVYAILNDGKPRHVKLESFWRHDGTRLPVEYRCQPIVEQRNVVGAVVSFRDLRQHLKQQEVERELQAAEAVQQQLYPSVGPLVPGLDIAGAAFPAVQACGDYFDFIESMDGSLSIVVGDVSGHGLGPALHMVETRAYLRMMLRDSGGNDDTLTRLNTLLEKDLPEGSFVSLFLMQLDAEKNEFRYSSAGHRGIMLSPDGEVHFLDSTGHVLGLLPNSLIPFSDPIAFCPESMLILATDGLNETLNPPGRELYGYDRIAKVAHANRHLPSREIIDRLYDSCREYSGGQRQQDDISMVVVKALPE